MKQKSEIRKVFITKYWLTKEIIEAELEVYEDGYAYGKLYDEPGYMPVHWIKYDYELTLERAKKKVCKLAEGRIRTLEKQILKARKIIIKNHKIS